MQTVTPDLERQGYRCCGAPAGEQRWAEIGSQDHTRSKEGTKRFERPRVGRDDPDNSGQDYMDIPWDRVLQLLEEMDRFQHAPPVEAERYPVCHRRALAVLGSASYSS